MKKIFILIILLAMVITVPYWTGIVAERNFSQLNQSLYEQMNLQAVANDYQRGWFHSRAHAIVEPAGEQRQFVLVHDISHGLVPIKSVFIQSSLQNVTAQAEKEPLLAVNTVVQLNGDSESTFKAASASWQSDGNHFQWQGLHGKVLRKRNSNLLKAVISSQYLQLENAKTQISIHNLSLDSYLPIGEGELKPEVGKVIMQQLQIHSSEQPPIQMEQVNLVGKHYAIHQDYLTMAMTVNVQRVHQGTESYGPGIGELELQHWHLPSLLHVGKTLFQVSPWSKFAPEQLFKFMPEGLVLLQNTPILTIKPFQLLTAEGEIQGQLDAKMEPFNAMLALLNPMLILNALTGELDMSIPSALVSAAKENTIWQTDINRPGYAHTRLQIRQGMVDINGEKTPLTTWFSKN